MRQKHRRNAVTGRLVLTVTVVLFMLVSVAACGGEAANEEDVDLEKTVTAENWDITLSTVPETANVVGEGGFTSQAKGKYAIVFLTAVNNSSDIRLFPAGLLQVVDGEGNTYEPTGSTVQFNLARTREGVNLLLDSPMQGNETRKAVLIFDVPSGATDLRLQMEGVEETLRLGL